MVTTNRMQLLNGRAVAEALARDALLFLFLKRTILGKGSSPWAMRAFTPWVPLARHWLGSAWDCRFPSQSCWAQWSPPGPARWSTRVCRVAERRRQQAGTLSGGEQQMLAVAPALMSDPDLLAMDEPSMGLAPLFVKQVLAIADRAYVLQVGEVKLTGPARELLKDEVVLKTYLGG